MRVLANVLVALLLTLPAAVSAKIYRWVDAKGQVHFSQVPPAGRTFEELAKPAPASEESAAPVAGDTATRTFLERVDTENRARAEAESLRKAAADDARAQCDRARARVAFLDERTPRRLATENPDGSMSRMDEAEFARRRDAAQHEIDAYCAVP